MARNSFISWQRTKKLRSYFSWRDLESKKCDLNVETTVHLNLQERILYKALTQLRERDRLIIELYVLAKLPAAEVAVVANCN